MQSSALLAIGAVEAAAVLRTVVHDPEVAAQPGTSVRVSAARTLLAAIVAHRDQVGAEDRRLGTASRGNWWTPARGVVSDNRGRVRRLAGNAARPACRRCHGTG